MFDAYVSLWAKAKPQALAIVTLQSDVTYAQFDRDIDRFAAGFAALDPPASGLVGVRLANPYAHWLALMALSRLRIASASMPLMERSGGDVQAALQPALLLTDSVDDRAHRVVLLSTEWIAATLRAPGSAIAAPACDLDAIGRVTTSSGTTGKPKAIPFTWRKIIDRAMRRAAIDRSRDEHVLVLAGNDTNHGFSNRIATWIAGATTVMGPDVDQLPAALASLRVGLLVLSPGHLQALVAALPANFQPVPGLRIRIGGAATAPALAREARLRLTADIQIAYASTEGGAVAMGPAALLDRHPGNVGYRLPGTEVEAIDPAGMACPPGIAGELRVRGAEMIGGYHDEAAQNGHAFRQGWFHPGDIGAVLANGEIRILGRTDDLMNLGGVKLLPGAIEDVLRPSSGIADIAVFAVPSTEGVEALWAAVVRTDAFDAAELNARLHAAMPRLPPLRIALSNAIPRNSHGKVDLRQLRQLVTAAQHASVA